jgi:hypothetical protein
MGEGVWRPGYMTPRKLNPALARLPGGGVLGMRGMTTYVAPLIAAGKIKYREDHSAGSGAIPASFAEMLRGDSFGKMLVQLSPDPTLGQS